MQWIERAWRGEEKLWKVFWLGLLLPFLLAVVVGCFTYFFNIRGAAAFFSAQPWQISQSIYYVLLVPLVWKSMRNSSGIVWGWLAVFFTLVVAAAGIHSLIPVNTANYNQACVKLMEDFALKNGLNPKNYIAQNRHYLEKCTKDTYQNACLNRMRDFARSNNLNPQEYIKQNQTYLRQCTQELTDSPQDTNATDGSPQAAAQSTTEIAPATSAIQSSGVVNPAPQPAKAPSNAIAELPVKLGDTVSQVQAALQTTMEPEVMDTSNGPASMMNAGKTVIHLKTEGIWVFFDRVGKVYTIRVDAPFRGKVFGIQIGDGLTAVKSVLGEPIKKPVPSASGTSYFYAPNDMTTLRLDLDMTNAVEVIFLIK